MKKVMTLVVMMLLVLSIVPVVYSTHHLPATGGSTGIKFEIDDSPVEEDEDTDDEDSDDVEEELESYAEDEIESDDISECIDTLSDEFPDAAQRLINKVCDEHIDPPSTRQVTVEKSTTVSGTSNLSRCVDFLEENTDTIDAKELCDKFATKQIQCASYLEGKGVEYAQQRCDSLFGKVTRRVVQATTSGVSLQRIAHLSDEAKQKITSLPQDAQEVITHLPVNKQVELLKLSDEELREAASKYRVTTLPADEAFKKRQITRDELALANQEYKSAKERFLEASENYQAQKAEFLNIRKKVQACEGIDSAECSQLEEDILKSAQIFLKNAADKAIEHLNKIIHRVESADGLAEEHALDIIIDLEEAIGKLESAKSDVDDASSKQDIEESAQEINSIWKNIKDHATLHTARIVNAKLGGVIARSGHLEEKLACSIASLDDTVDTKGISDQLEAFSSEIGNALENHEKADESFLEAESLWDSDSDKIDSLFSEGKTLTEEAEKDLKEAHSILRSIVSDIKSLGGEITSCDDSDEIVIVEEIEE